MSVKKENKTDNRLMIEHISPKDIKDNPYQNRNFIDPEGLKSLKESIRKKGVLQPLLVRKENDKIFLVAGQRRLEASKKLKLSTIPVIFVEDDPIEIGLIENLQRENLHPIDESIVLKKFQEHKEKQLGKCTKKDLALIIGKKQKTVSNLLQLTELPDDIKSECGKDPRWKKKVLLSIAKKETENEIREAFKKAKKKFEQKENIKPLKENKDDNNSAIAMKVIDNITNKIKKIKMESISDQKKLEIKKKLEDLQKELRKIFRKFAVK